MHIAFPQKKWETSELSRLVMQQPSFIKNKEGASHMFCFRYAI